MAEIARSDLRLSRDRPAMQATQSAQRAMTDIAKQRGERVESGGEKLKEKGQPLE
jgi:hypothetical protein